MFRDPSASARQQLFSEKGGVPDLQDLQGWRGRVTQSGFLFPTAAQSDSQVRTLLESHGGKDVSISAMNQHIFGAARKQLELDKWSVGRENQTRRKNTMGAPSRIAHFVFVLATSRAPELCPG